MHNSDHALNRRLVIQNVNFGLQSFLLFHDHTKQILILYCIFGLHNFILHREGVQEQFIPSGGEDDEDKPSEFDFVNDERTLRCEIAQKL